MITLCLISTTDQIKPKVSTELKISSKNKPLVLEDRHLSRIINIYLIKIFPPKNRWLADLESLNKSKIQGKLSMTFIPILTISRLTPHR